MELAELSDLSNYKLRKILKRSLEDRTIKINWNSIAKDYKMLTSEDFRNALFSPKYINFDYNSIVDIYFNKNKLKIEYKDSYFNDDIKKYEVEISYYQKIRIVKNFIMLIQEIKYINENELSVWEYDRYKIDIKDIILEDKKEEVLKKDNEEIIIPEFVDEEDEKVVIKNKLF